MSRALGRLRSTFDDPLLVHDGKGLILTPRAERLVEPVAAALATVQEMLHSEQFDPAEARGDIHIEIPDHFALVFRASVASPYPHTRARCESGVRDVVGGLARTTSARANWTCIRTDYLRSGTVQSKGDDRSVDCAAPRRAPCPETTLDSGAICESRTRHHGGHGEWPRASGSGTQGARSDAASDRPCGVAASGSDAGRGDGHGGHHVQATGPLPC